MHINLINLHEYSSANVKNKVSKFIILVLYPSKMQQYCQQKSMDDDE